MSKSAKEIFEKLPEQRKIKIQAEAQILLKEYKSLQEFRKSLGMTQVELAKEMSISQVTISKLEKRKDMHISTLKKYVEALGGQLEINIKLPKNELDAIE